MKSSQLYASFFLAAGLALLFLAVARADENIANFKFSDSTKPGTLKIHVGRGDIRVVGADAPEITIVSDSSSPESTSRKDGLRLLTASSSYSFAEKNNVATLDYGLTGRDGRSEFRITVPRSTTVVIGNSWGGDITCGDLTGNIDIKCLNGDVRLNGVRAGAVVETMNGSIRADVRELHPGQPICFTSMNGAVTIRIASDAKASVRLRTQNGAILTDFDEKTLVTKTEITPDHPRHGVHVVIGDADGSDGTTLNEETREAIREAAHETAKAAHEAAIAMREAAEAAREGLSEANGSGPTPPLPPIPPLPAMTGGKLVSGALNGGGPDIQATTMNGDVILRKAETKN